MIGQSEKREKCVLCGRSGGAEDDVVEILHPVVQDFKDFIESDTRVFMLFSSMFEQVPDKSCYDLDPLGRPRIRNGNEMIRFLNQVIKSSPEYHGDLEFLGLPLLSGLLWPMSTSCGRALFLDDRVNAHLKSILDAWGRYLKSHASASVLNTKLGGWLCQDAREAIARVANCNGKTNLTFDEIFVCDPQKPHFGFNSWDEFFTRKFRDGLRPLAAPTNYPESDPGINNACESTPYCLATNVAKRDQFWVKGSNYSLVDLLAHDPRVDSFVGGSIYQAFLSALSYHRWHSPVSGTVVHTHTQPGHAFSTPFWEGSDKGDGSIDDDIRCLLEVETRVMIYIQADNPAIGLVCVLPVGIAEISSCEITVQPGQRVTKGDEIGMFHYGGSTYCMIFGPQVDLEWSPEAKPRSSVTEVRNVPVNSQIARIRPSK